MTTVNVIGAGRWGPNVVRTFMNLPDADVHYVCDLSEVALDRVRKNISGIKTTTDVREAITDPAADAIVIATPVRTHHALTLMALEAGKHVFAEKPLSASLDECLELQHVAKQKGLILAVGHIFLFNAGIQKIREYIESGELGSIHYIHATRTNLGPVRDDVNAAWDLASHDISIFDYWLKSDPISVNAQGQYSLGRNQHDVVVATYHYPGNVMCGMHVSWLNPQKVREITIVGSKKMAVWNDMDLIEPVRVYDKSATFEDAAEYADSFVSTQATIRDGDVVIPKVSGGEPLKAECSHFIDCIRNDTQPINDVSRAISVVESLIAMDRSLEHRGAEKFIHRHTAMKPSASIEQRLEALFV